MSKDEANNGTHNGDISSEGRTDNGPVLQTGEDLGLVSTSDTSQGERASRDGDSDKVTIDSKSQSNIDLSDSGDKSLAVHNVKVDSAENTSSTPEKVDDGEGTKADAQENKDLVEEKQKSGEEIQEKQDISEETRESGEEVLERKVLCEEKQNSEDKLQPKEDPSEEKQKNVEGSQESKVLNEEKQNNEEKVKPKEDSSEEKERNVEVSQESKVLSEEKQNREDKLQPKEDSSKEKQSNIEVSQESKDLSDEKQTNRDNLSSNEDGDLSKEVKDSSISDQSPVNESKQDLQTVSEDSTGNHETPKHVSFSEPEVVGPNHTKEVGENKQSAESTEDSSTESKAVESSNDKNEIADSPSDKEKSDKVRVSFSEQSDIDNTGDRKVNEEIVDEKIKSADLSQVESVSSEKITKDLLPENTAQQQDTGENKTEDADDGDAGYEDDFEETEPVNDNGDAEDKVGTTDKTGQEQIVDSNQVSKEGIAKEITDSESREETNDTQKVDSDKELPTDNIDKLEQDIQQAKEDWQNAVSDKTDTDNTSSNETAADQSGKSTESGEDIAAEKSINEKSKNTDVDQGEKSVDSGEETKEITDEEGKPKETDSEADKDKLENPAESADQGETSTEPEEGVTKIIVDDDGIPKVSVTTVPDRPPSSEPEDNNTLEQTDSAVNDNDNFYDTDVNDKKENEVTSDTVGENKDESKIVDENDKTKTPTEEADEVEDKSFQQITNSGELSARSEDGTESEKVEENVTVGHKKFKTDSSAKQSEENMDDVSEEHSKTMHGGDGTAVDNEQSVEKDIGTNDKTESVESSESKENSNKSEEKETKPVTPELKKVETPLEKLLKRNVEIDGTVETITQLEDNVVTLLKSMKDVMSHYGERLKLQTLKDITDDMGKFRGDFSSVNDAFKKYSKMTQNVNARLKELRYVTEDVKTQISRKFVSEDLSTWVDIPPEKEEEKERLQDEVIAAEKVAMVRASEARQAMATATVGVAQAQQLVTEMEVQTAEAEAVAIKAEAQAKISIIAAEEAKKAAEERRIAEEASKRRAEDRARVKAEEAKKKAAEEEKIIHMEAAKKGTKVEDERDKFMQEKARKEAERRNPKNWPKYGYNAPGNDFNPNIGCVVRAIDGSMRSGDIDCDYIDQSSDVLKLRENEELVSNIIQINPTDADKKFSFEEPFSIALPVCFNRVQLGREAVVKQLVANGAWKELPSADVQFEEHRETKFIEGRTRTFGTFAVVMTLKKVAIQFNNKAGKVVSTVDSRISFSTQKGTFKHETNGILEVQSLDVNSISVLKQRAPVECENLLTSSPIIKLQLPEKRLNKPLTVSIPVPSLQQRQTRPATAVARPAASEDARPATARPTVNKEEENPEEVRFVYKDEKNGWTAYNKLELGQMKNKDIVTFDFIQPFEKFVLLRTKPGVKDSMIEKMATLLEKTLTQRNVKVALRQNRDEASEVAIVCTTSIRADRALQSLDDEGFTEGPVPSSDLILLEGQQMYMRFRGNIHCVTENPTLDFIFNSNIKTIRKFQVMELDVFAQKSIHCYRGFIQVFTKTFVPKPSSDSTQKTQGTPEMVEAEVLLTELLVELPKPETEPPRPLRVAPISLNDGPLTHLVFRHIAAELGKEWRDLGAHLNLRPTRIQAILRQNVNKDTPQTRYDMLVTWAKRIPKGVDKVQILCHALIACGRHDLSEEVRYKGEEFKQQRHNQAKPSHLKKAFVKVAKCQEVFRHWQKFAKRLGVPEDEIQRIEETGGSGQEKCYTSLEQWSKTAGDQASIPELSNQLKYLKQPNLSKEVESVVVS